MEKIIIIGAGAAGLMAGCNLIDKNREVIILEARDRIGGRMHTIREGFSRYIEEGAEFVHGELALTLSVLKEARAHHYPMKGRIWRYFEGELNTDDSFIEDDRILNSKLREIEHDMTVKQFLRKYFDPSTHANLITSIRKFVEGYDSADYDRASAFALRDEWLKEDDSKQFHIAGGYELLYNHLANKFIKSGGKILLNTIVRQVDHSKKKCVIIANKKFVADKVIVTVPTGVLADRRGKGYIRFTPRIPELKNWIEKSGYGSLIKIIIEFSVPFWEHDEYKNMNVRQTKEMMFVFSDMRIPTWWSQSPDSFPLLTGWLAGPQARKMKNKPDNIILNHALNSLSKIYQIDKKKLKSLIKASHVKNWTADPFTRGSYSYKTTETAAAYEKMKDPFGSLYFAGEALTSGSENGTVEAALLSGAKVAAKILK